MSLILFELRLNRDRVMWGKKIVITFFPRSPSSSGGSKTPHFTKNKHILQKKMKVGRDGRWKCEITERSTPDDDSGLWIMEIQLQGDV